MTRRHAAPTLAVCALALAAAPAQAVTPKLGTYTGEVAGKVIKLKVLSKKSARYTYDCGANGGPVSTWTKVKITPKGSFSGADSGVSALKGRFTASRTARATFSVEICGGEGGSVKLTKAG